MKKLDKKKIKLSHYLRETIEAKRKIIFDANKIEKIIRAITKKMKNNGKLLICGNGGSAADAQHLAAEFLVRLNPKKNRKPFPAISLAMDTSTITACGNDYKFENIFERNFKALAFKHDVLLIISTSGNSKNIIKVLKEANKQKVLSIGFLGSGGGKAKKYCDLSIIIRSKNVARIQECHIFLGHFILSQVENHLLNG